MLNKETISKYIKPMAPEPTHLEQRGQLKEKIRCILFDVYGTLFISGSGDISIAKKSAKGIEETWLFPIGREVLFRHGFDLAQNPHEQS